MGTICVKRRMYSEALIETAEGGQHDYVKALIKAGADVNYRTSNGRTALMRAAVKGHDKCVAALLKAGADVNIADSYQETALLCAAVNGHDKCLNLLIKKGADVNRGSGLIRAAANGYDECVARLVYAGADVSSDGTAAMIEAIKQGSHKCVDILIKAGADLDACDAWNDTALSRSAKDNRYKCLELLIRAGVDVNSVDRDGNSALMAAVDCRHDIMHMWTPRSFVSRIKCVQLLLRAGAHVNKTNRFGQNTIDLHVRRVIPQDEDIAMLLFAAGETIDGTTVKRLWWDSGGQVKKVRVPDYLKPPKTQLNLNDICRKVIRKHLQQSSPINLFARIPKLGLPPSITEYLLYEMSLETDYRDDDDDDDDDNYGDAVQF